MPLNYSPYMNMALANSSDGDVKFLTWRVAIDGSQGTSNFMIIDKKFEDTDTEMAKLKNVSSLVYLAATKANDNQFNATSTNIEEYKENMVIILSLNNPVLGQTALKVNDLAAVYIKKFDMSQNLVDLQKDDLRASRNYLLRYDTSGYWVVVSQIRATDFFTAGVSNNILKVENNLITDSGQSIDKVAHNRGEYANEAALLLVTDGSDGDYAIVLDTATMYVWANDKWNSTVASYYSKTESDDRYLQLSGGSITGTLNGTDASFTGNLSVDGTSTLTGKVTTGNGMDVTSDLSVGGTADITTNATVGGTLIVTGATTLKNSLTGTTATFTGITDNGNLSVTGTSTLAGITGTTLTLSGEAALNGGISTTTLKTSSTASIGTDLTVLGNSTLKATEVSTLKATGDSTLSKVTATSLDISGDTTFTGGIKTTSVALPTGVTDSIQVDSAAQFNKKSDFKSAVTMTNNLQVDGISSLRKLQVSNIEPINSSGNINIGIPGTLLFSGTDDSSIAMNANMIQIGAGTASDMYTGGIVKINSRLNCSEDIGTSSNINLDNNGYILNVRHMTTIDSTTTFPLKLATIPNKSYVRALNITVKTAAQAGANLGIAKGPWQGTIPTTPNIVAYNEIVPTLVSQQIIYIPATGGIILWAMSDTGITAGNIEITLIFY